MALSENQLLMLNLLVFTDFIRNGDTVREIVCRLEAALDQNIPMDTCRMKPFEWRRLADAVKNQPDLLAYHVRHYRDGSHLEKNMACFVDDPDNPRDVIVVFRGTSKNDDWRDNGRCSYQADTEKQREAAEYVNGLPGNYGNEITVTGHSKGGNKAQYVTMVTDRVGRCVTFDGLGFSKEFIEKYADEISKKSDCITAISVAEDYVNSILLPIADKRTFVESNLEYVSHFVEYHKPNVFLNGHGELNPPKEQSSFSKRISEYTAYVLLNVKDSKKGDDINGLILFFEKMANVHVKLSRHLLQPLWDFLMVFILIFFVMPFKMPAAFGGGIKLLIHFIGADIRFAREHHSYISKKKTAKKN